MEKNLNRADVLAFVSLFIICITWHIRPDIRALWEMTFLGWILYFKFLVFEHFKNFWLHPS